MRLEVLLLMCFVFLQGCTVLGFAVRGDRTSSIVNPNVSTEKRCIERNIEGVSPITSEELFFYWGKPNDVYKYGSDREIWRYEYGLRWNGLIIGIIIPIPIIIPVGHDYVDFSIEENNVTSAFMKNDSGLNGVMVFEYKFGIRPTDSEDKIQLEKYGTIGYKDNVILKEFLCLGDYRLVR